MIQNSVLLGLVVASCLVWSTARAAGPNESSAARLELAKTRLASAGKQADLKIVEGLGHREAFRIRATGDKMVVEATSQAGLLYGAQALAAGDYVSGRLEKPDLDIRGTTLCLMSGSYKSTMSPRTYPWFYDKAFMTRTLDAFAEARMNTIFVWSGHLFPHIVEMPDYPEASADLSREQIKANQEQFRWFTTECDKRNIQVLLHFYNIQVPSPFAKKHSIASHPSKPTPLLEDYTRYALSRYFKEFPSVGLYACPGESLESKSQLHWFRDVIFKAAKDSGKNPVIVIRDWTLNMDFQKQLKGLYGRVYSELKHNDESATSPYPDVRHLKWDGLSPGHIINAVHGPAEDLQPMRWASPCFVQEMVQRWKSLGFVKGVEFWGQSFWRWPYTFDKLAAKEADSVVDSSGKPRLVYLDRDAPFYAVAGRYMWNAQRRPADEESFWRRYHSKRYGSDSIGERMARWYTVSGPISPGIQNLNATKVANFWATILLVNQNLDQILTYNKNLSETPYTLNRETGRARQRYYPRPYDSYFFGRYRKEYGLPEPGENPAMYKEFAIFKQRMAVEDLAQRHCMPVSQYAENLEAARPVKTCMTPDKVVRLLHKLANESLTLAREMEAACADPARKPELHRFVTDSRMYVLATEAMIHKEDAAIIKARMLLSGSPGQADAFMREMQASVRVYEQLAALTDETYHYANGLRRYHWSKQGIDQWRKDLALQKKWLEEFKASRNGKS